MGLDLDAVEVVADLDAAGEVGGGEGVPRGALVVVSSVAALGGSVRNSSYSASKGGVVQLTKSLAVAWAPHGIQVNSILPGFIDTDLTRAGRIKTPEMFARIESDTPAGRWGIPDDLAGLAVFLASSASDFVTGTAIPVDGGYSAQM